MAEMAEIRAEQKKFSCCSICDSDVIDFGICCDTCERWCHPKCAWISNEEYYRLGSCDDLWLCPACCLPSFNTSLFEISSSLSYNNLSVSPNLISISHLNTRSILSSFAEFSSLMTSHQFHVITLSETWLDETVSDTEVPLPGYTIIRNDRNHHGGGVAILINNSIRCTPHHDLQLNSVETM